eukprot:CAMPEP_0196807580 /NCGR_PEP_ID=MMETSP1362-20130617/7580_1 /TAXON_ID=163516 /ORGANISM="Leptocylindrus danicus, Strain CCMP1856" /LENGTH=512 /DNA_ID=CAMNT_0042181569 /DNA_START=37 /DNA_END=1575 /DNA_ORIENTATION=+
MPDSNEYKTEIVRRLVGPSLGKAKIDFACANGSYSGRLYVCTNGAGFYSNLFGFERTVCIHWKHVTKMKKMRTSSILLQYVGTSKNGKRNTKEHIFKSIADRDNVFDTVSRICRQVNPNIEGDNSTDDCKDVSPEFSGLSEGADSSDLPKISDLRASINAEIRSQGIRHAANAVNQLANVEKQPLNGSFNSETSVMDKEKEELTVYKIEEVDELGSTIYDGKNGDFVTKFCPDQDNFGKAWNELVKSSEDYFKFTAVKKADLPDISLEAFFETFLSDDAENSISSFHESIGDIINNTDSWTESANGFHRIRTINLDHPVPGYGKAKTTKHQHCRVYGTGGICIDSHTESEGLPAVDCFYVEDRMLIEANEDGGLTLTGLYHTVWTKTSWMKGIAEKSANAASADFFKGFIEMINNAGESALPPVIIELQKEHKEEGQKIEETRFALLFVILFVLFMLVNLIRVRWKMGQLGGKVVELKDEIDYLKSQLVIALAKAQEKNGLGECVSEVIRDI